MIRISSIYIVAGGSSGNSSASSVFNTYILLLMNILHVLSLKLYGFETLGNSLGHWLFILPTGLFGFWFEIFTCEYSYYIDGRFYRSYTGNILGEDTSEVIP